MKRDRVAIWSFFILFAFGVVLGGGGSPNPATELVVPLVSAAVLAALIVARPADTANFDSDRVGWALIAAIVALPLIQLIPLPPALWSTFPGREPAVAALQAVGAWPMWRPLSLFPAMTLAAALALVPPIVAIRLVTLIEPRDRHLVVASVLVAALASAILGLFQYLAHADTLRLYATSTPRFAAGFFANRNAFPDLLLAGLLALVALSRTGNGLGTRRGAALLAAAILVLAILASGSRTGMALLVVPAVTAALALPRATSRRGWVKRGTVLATAAVALVAVLQLPALKTVTDRFDGADTRTPIWADALVAIERHWPAGSGMGTFVPINTAIEDLAKVEVAYTNRAHDDYLEVALEGGVAAVLLVAAALAFVAVRLRTRPADPAHDQRLFAAGVLIVIALHSVVDYPVRSLTLAMVAGLALAMLMRPGVEEGKRV